MSGFSRIDKGLGIYYANCGRHDYFEDGDEGKFMLFVKINGFDETQIELELGQDVKANECLYIDMDDDFPLGTHNKTDSRNEMIFNIIQHCYKFGVPPNTQNISDSITTVGDKVKLKKNNLVGTVRFVGEVRGKKGIFYGIELKHAKGENNGSIDEIVYFKCETNKGLFVKEIDIYKTSSKNNKDIPRVTVGDGVKCIKAKCNGTIRFIGTPYSVKESGTFYGIELEKANGLNNGTINSRRFFSCKKKFGIFLQCNGFTKIERKQKKQKKRIEYKVGDRVMIKINRKGQIKWIGEAKEFGSGLYFGIRLTENRGDNDGKWKERRFFQCPQGFGVYVRLGLIKKHIDDDFDYTNEEEKYFQEAKLKNEVYKQERDKLQRSREEYRSIKRQQFIKTSTFRTKHYDKFPTLKDYAMLIINNDDNKTSEMKETKLRIGGNKKVTELTNKILANKPSGDPSKRDTLILLHVLNGAANNNGKKCLFFDSSQDITPKTKSDQDSYLNMLDADDAQSAKFVLKLTKLDGLVKNDKTFENVAKIKELKESLTNNKSHPIIEDIRSRLAKAHGIDSNRIVITDFYLNGVGAPYYIKDLTKNERNNIITQATQLNKNMDALFPNYDSCCIHPALFHHTYDINMFDERGNKTFDESENETFKVGPTGKEREYVQPTGWTRYGLKVLGKYDNDLWLHPFQDKDNWYRAFHGTSRMAGSSIYKGAFRSGSNNAYGDGIYCTPDVNIAASYCASRGGTIKLETQRGTKQFYFVFQVAVNPDTMNNAAYISNFDPSCEDKKYWIAPTGADIRPYGILIKEV